MNKIIKELTSRREIYRENYKTAMRNQDDQLVNYWFQKLYKINEAINLISQIDDDNTEPGT